MSYTPVTYNLGDTGSNQFAAGVNSMLSAFGMNQNLSGEIGGFMGQITTPQFQNALQLQEQNNPTSAQNSSNESWYNKAADAVAHQMGFDVPGTSNQGTGNLSASWVARAATIGIGVILILGGLYLFGSSSMADAISEIGPALKASHQKSLSFYRIRKSGKALSTT